MNDNYELEQAFQQALPKHLHSKIDFLTQILQAVLSQETPRATAAQQIAEIEGTEELLAALANKSVCTRSAVIDFGQSQMGDISINDVISGNKYELTIDYSPKIGGQLNAGNNSSQILAQYSTIYVQTDKNLVSPWSIGSKEVTSVAAPELTSCPYPGIVQYGFQDAVNFFGREQEIAEIIRHCRHFNLLLVTGPSGSGKSSLISAGVLPRLKKDRSWQFVNIRPGTQPAQRLKVALGLSADMPIQADTAVLMVNTALLQNKAAKKLLIIVDQTEEIFTLASREECQEFLRLLQYIYASEKLKEICTIILIARIDFLGDLMDTSAWPAVSSRPQIQISPLRGSALRKAIVEPARKSNITIEPSLAERLLADASDEPGALPLLQETMVFLWGFIEDGRIPLQAYYDEKDEKLNGLSAAIAIRAEAVYDNLTSAQQKIARRIFIRLIQFGEGRPDTRRQQKDMALRSSNENPEEFAKTIAYLTEHRLLTISIEDSLSYRGKSTSHAEIERRVDIAHEALISGWPRLKEWIADQRESELVRRRLQMKVDEWVRLGKQEGGLLDKVELDEVKRWMNSNAAEVLGVNSELQALLESSQSMLKVKAAQEMLATLSTNLSSTMVFDDILVLVMNFISQHIDCDTCALLILDENPNRIRFSQTIGLVLKNLAGTLINLEEHEILRATIRERRSTVLDDVDSMPSYDTLASIGWRTRSWAATPIFVDDHPLGILGFGSEKVKSFTMEFTELTTALVHRISYAMYNARRFTQMMNQVAHSTELNTQLGRQQAMLQAVLRDIGDGLLVVDDQGMMVLANPVAYQVLQQSDETGGSLRDDLDQIVRTLHDNREAIIERELQYGEEDQQQTYQIFASLARIDAEDRSYVVIVLRNITDYKLQERRRIEFISMVSHELRNPVNTASGFLKVVLQGRAGLLNELQQEFLGLAESQVDALKGRINELLEFNRLETGQLRLQPQWSNLTDLLLHTSTRFQIESEPLGLTVEADVPNNIPELLIDSERIGQVMTNLIENAMKATPAGGHIQLSAQIHEHEVQVQVADTGVGIAPDQIEKIFSRFYRLENKASKYGVHLGLGLSICQQIVEGHNGRIWVESKEGKGSRFYFTLPLVTKGDRISNNEDDDEGATAVPVLSH